MLLDVITLFPEMFAALTEQGVVSRAFKNNVVNFKVWNPREFTYNNHKTIDDRPYGGGPGMVMMVQPLVDAIAAARARQAQLGARPHVIYMSPQGQKLTQTWVAQTLSQVHTQTRGLIVLCGRYEAIDERLFDLGLIDEELSVGDVVVSGGELPAMLMLDALLRCVTGVLNDTESALQDSFSDGLLDCAHYTRPEVFADLSVPDVLLSGNHAKIAVFRREQQLSATVRKRPDLIEAARAAGLLSAADEKFLIKLK